MMLLPIFYNVRSERELVKTIPLRLDWLCFLGYDLDDEIPNRPIPVLFQPPILMLRLHGMAVASQSYDIKCIEE